MSGGIESRERGAAANPAAQSSAAPRGAADEPASPISG